LVELAETRSIARALRFAGFGLEFCGAEEIAHVPEGDPEPQRTVDKQPAPVFPEGNGNGKVAAKAPSGATADEGSKLKNGCTGTATQAQVRALFALSRRANY